MYFQDLIFNLQKFWTDQGCIMLQPYDMEVGAGTSNPATTLGCLDPKPSSFVYVQPCRRPADARYGENPNRMQHYYQMQVILKPTPANAQELCLESFKYIGLDPKKHDFRFVEDDWENPTIGAWGLGWEVWCDGMEILQFTYMQQIGGLELKSIPCEMTYGLERLAMFLQKVTNVWDLEWNDRGVKYRDVFYRSEVEYSKYNFEYADTKLLLTSFEQYEKECNSLIAHGLSRPAFDQCIKASHAFNLLEARGVISVAERVDYIARVRTLAKACSENYVASLGEG